MVSNSNKRTTDCEWLPLDEDKAPTLAELIRSVSNREVVEAAVAIGAVKKSGKFADIKRIRLLKANLTKLRSIPPADQAELESSWVDLRVYRDKRKYYYFEEPCTVSDTFTPWSINGALAKRLLPYSSVDYSQAELVAAIVVGLLFGYSYPPYRCRYRIKPGENRIRSTRADST